MNISYLDTLKAFVEGDKDIREWPTWWHDNASLIEVHEGRTCYLKIKLQWLEGACEILEHHSITYKLDASANWDRCKECGEPLFHAIPKATTKEEIMEFARNSNLPDKARIEKEGYIHPGTFCPNGCTATLITYRDDTDERFDNYPMS
jgi:hypothetical protein